MDYYCRKGIKFKCMTAWSGEFWESMVKLIKICLRKILERVLSYEELQTIVTDIEAIINSLPIAHEHDYPFETPPLIPSHF
ncbi:hypothetical protein X975_13383, partial [Stegodyphus mimosarum]